MKLTTIAGALLAVLMVATGAAAAMPADAPTDASVEQPANATDAQQNGSGQADVAPGGGDENPSDGGVSDAEDADENASPAGIAEDRRGPPSDMPAQVPDFVTDIHDLVQQKIDGTLSSLGDQVSSLTPGGEADGGGSDGPESDDGTADGTENDDSES